MQQLLHDALHAHTLRTLYKNHIPFLYQMRKRVCCFNCRIKRKGFGLSETMRYCRTTHSARTRTYRDQYIY